MAIGLAKDNPVMASDNYHCPGKIFLLNAINQKLVQKFKPFGREANSFGPDYGRAEK
jgi:hypothetical protein